MVRQSLAARMAYADAPVQQMLYQKQPQLSPVPLECPPGAGWNPLGQGTWLHWFVGSSSRAARASHVSGYHAEVITDTTFLLQLGCFGATLVLTVAQQQFSQMACTPR